MNEQRKYTKRLLKESDAFEWNNLIKCSNLNKDQYKIVEYVHTEEYTMQQIAFVMNCSQRTVKRKYAQALNKISKAAIALNRH